MREARAARANEALIVDRDGRVVEGASSNLFIVRDGILITPPLEAGILAGVTRGRALRAADQLGLPTRFAVPTVDEVLGASEVFISSSIRELLPIVSVDGAPIGDGRVGDVTRRLRAAFRQVIAAEMARG
jgi:branched-chain amino acid aminotransferase